MAATSLLARLGLRIATLGSAANLAIAAPIAEGDVSMSAHTDATRVGVYFDRTVPADPFMGVVAGGTESMRVSKTRVDTFTKLVTAASTVAAPGFVLTPGVAPAAPTNGDVWLTGVDAYARINNVTRTLGEETYVASVNTEATLQAAVAAAEASSYKNAVITITANINITGGIGSTLTKNYVFVGTGSTGAGGGIRPIITKGNGPWANVSGKNLVLMNLQINATLSQNLFTIDPNVNVQCFGCSFTLAAGGNFFYRQYAGALTASFDNCTVAVSSGSFLWFGESNPADVNIPQGEVLFTGCTLSGLMVKCDNAGKVNCTLVGSTLTDPGTGCWYATEFSAGRSNLVVNYNSRDTTSLALAPGSTDTITFTNRASAGGSATLANTQVGVGDGSNLLSGSASLTFSGSTLKVSPAVAGDGTITLEAGTGATTARAILFLRGNVLDSSTGWFLLRNGTTVGSHLDLIYTPSANINDVANKHSVRFFTDGAIQFGGTFGASPGVGRFVFNANTAQQPGVLIDANGNGGNYITVKNTSSGAAAGAGLYLEAHSPARGVGLFAYSNGNTGTLFGITLASKAALFATSATCDGILIGSATACTISLGTTDVERMRVYADGGVQIGGAYTVSPGAGCLSLNTSLGNITRLDVKGRAQFISDTNTTEIAFFGHPGFQGVRWAGTSEGVLLESANNVATAANAGATFINFFCNATTSQMAMDIGRGLDRTSRLSRTAGGWAVNALTAVGRDAGYTTTTQTLFRVANRNPTGTLLLSGGARYFEVTEYDTTVASEMPIFYIDALRDVYVTSRLLNALGSATDPAYTFISDPNTGIFSAGADTLGLVTNGVERMRVYSDGGVQFGGPYAASPGLGSVYITGKLTVDGLIDPTGLQFDPVAANPGTAQTLWVLTPATATQYPDNSLRYGADLVPVQRQEVNVGGSIEANFFDLPVSSDTYSIIDFSGAFTEIVARIPTGMTMQSAGIAEVKGTTSVSINSLAGFIEMIGLTKFTYGENHAITKVNINTTLDGTYFTVLVDASGGPITISLPAISADYNRFYNIVKVDATGNAVNIVSNGADTINASGVTGGNTLALTVQYQSRSVHAYGSDTAWYVV